MVNDDIIWVDRLPERIRQPQTTRHLRYANKLKSQPGQWAWLRDVESGVAYAIRNGTITAYRPGGSFDACNIGGKVFARYLGEENDEPGSLRNLID